MCKTPGGSSDNRVVPSPEDVHGAGSVDLVSLGADQRNNAGLPTVDEARADASAGPTRGVCLPAYADLEWCAESGQRLAAEYVLIADTGGLPPQALRSQLARLARLQVMTGSTTPVVAVATTSGRRMEAWSGVLDSIAVRARGGHLDSCIHTWDAWRVKHVRTSLEGQERARGTASASTDSPAALPATRPLGERASADRCGSGGLRGRAMAPRCWRSCRPGRRGATPIHADGDPGRGPWPRCSLGLPAPRRISAAWTGACAAARRASTRSNR